MIYSETLSQEGEFLCLAARGTWQTNEITALQAHYRAIGEERVYSLGVANQMLPLIANALAIAGISDSANPKCRWEEILSTNQHRVDAQISILEEITVELRQAGCFSAAVEAGGVLLGTQLANRSYCSGDIDLLVQEEHWALVRDVFAAKGFKSKDRRGRPTTRIEYSRTTSDGEQWLEVGFAPFDRMWVPLNYNDRCDTWLTRTVTSTKAEGITVLCPNDALVFVAFHTSLHSFIRAPGLRLQVDVDRLVRDCDIDWEQFVQEVRSTGISTRVFVSLSMAKGLMNTPIPLEVLKELMPSESRWRGISYLLEQDGVIVGASPKLGKLKAVLLDVLISEKTVPAWIKQVVLPDEEWMRSHFDRDGTKRGSVWNLHRHRMMSLASRWRPE